MKKLKILVVLSLSVLTLISIMLSGGGVMAENPQPPSDPDQAWNPPEEGGQPLMPSGAKSECSSSYYVPPSTVVVPAIHNAYFIDENGRTRTQFTDEPFYLVVLVSSPGFFYVAEYYPAGSGLQPHWLVYRHNLSRAGTWTLGPFHPETFEPEGQHTWKMWLFSQGAWATRVERFAYQLSSPLPPYPYSTPTPTQHAGIWTSLQVLILGLLVGALGISVGLLIASRRSTAAGS
jgi:hypothetical protein